MSTIAKAFVAAKKEFAPALKTATNPHFKSKYADLAGCLEAVNEALLNNGIALYQETFEDGTGVTIETVFLHESGESLRGGKLHVPAAKQDPQGYGSALHHASQRTRWTTWLKTSDQTQHLLMSSRFTCQANMSLMPSTLTKTLGYRLTST